MDAYALAFKIARRILADGVFDEFVSRRYASYDSGFGKEISRKKIGFKELEKIALAAKEPKPISGRQEYLENLFMTYLAPGGH